MTRISPLPAATADSAWAATQELPRSRRLASNAEADVCIVGAGIAGLTTAYLLSQAGKKVIVLDDGPVASGMTHVTTAHLSNAIDDRFVNIEKWHGRDGARLAAQSHAAAIDRIEAIAAELEVDCDFQRLDGYLFRAPHDGEDDDFLEQEFAASQRVGVAGVEIVDRIPVDGFDSGHAIRYPNQARFHPFKYLDAVTRAIKKRRGHVYTNSKVDSVEGGDRATIKVGQFTVTADAVVVATNVPINDRVAIHTKQAPYMTYAIGVRAPKGSVTDALYWDTLHAYHYVRLQPMEDYDLLIVGGEDHKSGQAEDADERHANLLLWTRQRFPMSEEVEFTWGGQCMETVDGLAFIGRNPMDADNVYVVTGDSGMGITHGTIAGMLLMDMILGRENPWEKLYDPSRKTVSAAGSFLKENLNVATRYSEWLTPGEVDSVDEISKSSGAILRQGLTKLAVYRDEHGVVHKLSAVCPHLQCIVHWNPADTTWDCPCHGSRFRATGEVINGPANANLPPAED
jgi:glycine/D-amino acid oxidase-like deaminating enzyme/nitrite reductase/ring-hydroxylating ferredoxin subunit